MEEQQFKSIMDLPAIREFDAFPKTDPIYIKRSKRGGILTVVVGLLIIILIWFELKDYLFGEAMFSFNVDQSLGRSLEINLDLTVAMPCHYLSIDIRDAVGDRLHVSDELKKEGTTFEVRGAKTIDRQSSGSISASKAVTDSRSFLGSWSKPKFPKTKPFLEDGPACRIFGSVEVKKVAGNFHITTLGHGYLSWEHTDHRLMNLTHVITELSFGDFFPRIVQPLDNSLELTDKPFHIFQYFISVVPTTYVARSGHQLYTNQYSVTDMSRSTDHGKGIPGIFFKYDMEPMHLIIHEKTQSLIQFLVRLTAMIGGIIVCTSWSFRILNKIAKKTLPPSLIKEEDDEDDEDYDEIGGGYGYEKNKKVDDGLVNRLGYNDYNSFGSNPPIVNPLNPNQVPFPNQSNFNNPQILKRIN